MPIQILDDLWRDLDRLRRMGRHRAWLEPRAWAIAAYRLGRASQHLPAAARAPMSALQKLLQAVTGARLSREAEIEGGLFLAGGARVDPGAHLGRDCNLGPGAIVAANPAGAPWIGDRVYLGPRAMVIGPVRVGNGAAIGQGALVDSDVADGAVVGSVPWPAAPLPGRRRPDFGSVLRNFLRAVLPRPTQLLLRPG